MKNNEIVQLTVEFSLKIISFCEILEQQKKYVISRQLLRSGTSIGANVWEAQNAESRADFLHKLKIAAKEMEETDYWLLLCKDSPSYPYDEKLSEQLLSIRKVLTKIISTVKKNL